MSSSFPWIKMRDPYSDPKILAVAAAFAKPEPAMLAVLALRSFCASSRTSGRFVGKTAARQIEMAAKWSGRKGSLVDAMLDAGVVHELDDGFVVENNGLWGARSEVIEDDCFDDFRTPTPINETPEARSKRMARERQRRKRHAPVTVDVTPCHAPERDNVALAVTQDLGGCHAVSRPVTQDPDSCHAPVTQDPDSCHAPVTPPSRHVTLPPSDKERAIELDLEERQRLKNIPPLPPKTQPGPDASDLPESLPVGCVQKKSLPPVRDDHDTTNDLRTASDELQAHHAARVASRAAEIEAQLKALEEKDSAQSASSRTPNAKASSSPSLAEALAKFRQTPPLIQDEPTTRLSLVPKPLDQAPEPEQSPPCEPEQEPAPSVDDAQDGNDDSPVDTVASPVPDNPATTPLEQPNKPLRKKSPQAEAMRVAFESWWAVWPKKVSKGDAEKAWAQLAKTRELPPAATLIAATESQRHQSQWMKDGGQYIPHPATWLRRKGWLDELGPMASQSSRWTIGAQAPPSTEPIEELDVSPELKMLQERGYAMERIEAALEDGQLPDLSDLEKIQPHVLEQTFKRSAARGFDPRPMLPPITHLGTQGSEMPTPSRSFPAEGVGRIEELLHAMTPEELEAS